MLSIYEASNSAVYDTVTLFLVQAQTVSWREMIVLAVGQYHKHHQLQLKILVTMQSNKE